LAKTNDSLNEAKIVFEEDNFTVSELEDKKGYIVQAWFCDITKQPVPYAGGSLVKQHSKTLGQADTKDSAITLISLYDKYLPGQKTAKTNFDVGLNGFVQDEHLVCSNCNNELKEGLFKCSCGTLWNTYEANNQTISREIKDTCIKVASQLANKVTTSIVKSATGKELHVTNNDIIVKTRAISSRVNLNYDAWPKSELKKAACRFIEKPVFVDHVNDDYNRSRGIILDSTYQEENNEGFIELTILLDGDNFPLLVEEILTGGLDSVSMGCSVLSEICSICNQESFSEFDICSHLKRSKGKEIEGKLCYSICKDINFFEISLIVGGPESISLGTPGFSQADPTAVFSKITKVAKKKNFLDEPTFDKKVEVVMNQKDMDKDEASSYVAGTMDKVEPGWRDKESKISSIEDKLNKTLDILIDKTDSQDLDYKFDEFINNTLTSDIEGLTANQLADKFLKETKSSKLNKESFNNNVEDLMNVIRYRLESVAPDYVEDEDALIELIYDEIPLTALDFGLTDDEFDSYIEDLVEDILEYNRLLKFT
jgi:hypothetical protein